MLCRFTVTSPDIVIWLSVLLYYWAFISISTLILLISLLLSPNSGGGGIFHCPAGCAITFIFLWEATGRGKSANMPISSLPCSWAACGMALRGTLCFGGPFTASLWRCIKCGCPSPVVRKESKVMAGVVYSESLSLSTLSVSAGFSSVMPIFRTRWTC